MKQDTHHMASERLLGTPVEIVTGEKAVVELESTEEMRVDEKGLVHGGFTFGLADYAAMLAVNDPYVVIGGATCSFKAPVAVGDVMRAEAVVESEDRRKRVVSVTVSVEGRTVFTSEMTCFVLDRHVLGA